MRLKRETLIELFHFSRTLLVLPFSLIARRRYPNVWIITERHNQARDNGYCFFQYMKLNHPKQPVYYVIDKKSSDYAKVSAYGDVISFNSWKHYFYYCLSPIHISAHVGGCLPENNRFAKRLKPILNYKDVFIPHGVSYGIANFCLEKYAKIDLYICCGKPEYDNVLKNYGYSLDQVALTGFPRQDSWLNLRIKNNQILLMPTWRLYIAQDKDVVFENTEYYRAYQQLINNIELITFLQRNHLKLVFYPHHEMQKYTYLFHTPSENIEIVYDEKTHDIQELLKESSLLITDYSSVHFDFAYMEKPVIYYQFDQSAFYSMQYAQGEFSVEKNGFGPVVDSVDKLMRALQDSFDTGFSLSGTYFDRMRCFFAYHDTQNCSRVYEEIKKRWR